MKGEKFLKNAKKTSSFYMIFRQWFEDNKHGYGQYYFIKQKRVFQGLWSNDICKSSEQIC